MRNNNVIIALCTKLFSAVHCPTLNKNVDMLLQRIFLVSFLIKFLNCLEDYIKS